MANQFGSITSTFALLKNWYEGPIISQFNDEVPLYRKMEKGKEKYNGLQVVRPLKLRRNQGTGSTSDGGLLPTIGIQTTQQATILAKFNYLRFGITGPMIKASQGDRGAFISGIEFEMQQGLEDLKNDINRQLFWNGDGTIATVNANATGSTTIDVVGRTPEENGDKFLDVGTVIDIFDSTGVTLKASAVEITAVTGTTTATLTLSATVTVLATDLVVKTGSNGNDIQGLDFTMDGGTSTIYGIDRSVFSRYRSNVIDNGGAQMNLDVLQQTFNEGKNRGAAKYDCVIGDYDSERFYNKLLVADKRYYENQTVNGTYSKKEGSYLEYAGTPWIPDKDSPRRVYFLDTRWWKKYVLAELEWADETGTYLIAQTDTDEFESRLRLFANMFCEKPTAQAVLQNYVSP